MEMLGSPLLGLLGFAIFILWIFMLVDAARRGYWGWFVMMLLFTPLVVLYVIIQVPADRKSEQRRRGTRRRRSDGETSRRPQRHGVR